MVRVLNILVVLSLLAPVGAWATECVEPVCQQRTGLESGAWIATGQWDEEAEAEFSQWVETIGVARERRTFRLARGLKDPEVNPLYSAEDDELRFETDCATLPYALRAYFAYKTRRPYSWMNHKGRRYKAGNKPKDIRDWTQYPDFRRVMNYSMAAVSSGHFRMHAELEATDTYPIDLSQGSIRAGVTYYDPRGHVLVVYRVDEDSGDILMLDSHPDGTLTRKRFNDTYPRGSARFGGGFRAWRHYAVQAGEEGAFRMVRQLNSQSADYSASVQYQREFSVDGYNMGYHGFVRAAAARDGIYVYPLDGIERRLKGVCSSLQRRAEAVDEATVAGMPNKKHPNKLPRNIYRLYRARRGEWQVHSTPFLDSKIRKEVVELREFIRTTMRWAYTDDMRLKYLGGAAQLSEDYMRLWDDYATSSECKIDYLNSAGDWVELGLEDNVDRLFALSFDPYHCPELRWGAEPDSPEFASCPDGNRKLKWYEKERRLRNRISALLRRATPVFKGPRNPPKSDIVGLLHCYVANAASLTTCHGERVADSL
jgi:hypothetical protein